jgi:hypothetical protein
MTIEIQLPSPWPDGSTFKFEALPVLTWLVGPNGTGKSRFMRALREHAALASLKPRLLSTDRLAGARPDEGTRSLFGDRMASGLQKSHFGRWIEANHRDGAISGTVTLLYRRPDLRIRVEATLSQLLDRHIKLEMTDGNLMPKVRCGASPEYGMFSEECHGVLELLVLLANIYDDETGLLLIDEPEQNLHPQYQAFVLDELQRVGKKSVLATHSPSFMSVKTINDLQGVVCFHPDFSVPSVYHGGDQVDREVQEVLPRMTEQHRGFFFAEKPVFLEGYFDVTVVSAIQRSLGLSAEGAGSCLIPSLGKDEASRYLMLCNALGKRAVFLFDLDALFDQRLRVGAAQNDTFAARVASAGHGKFDELVGKLQRSLSDALTKIGTVADDVLPPALSELRIFLVEHGGDDELHRRRVAVLVAIAEKAEDVRVVLGEASDTIRGFLGAILAHLSAVDIHVLPGGALENYLPAYTGNRFEIPDEAKRSAALAEQSWLASPRDSAGLAARYGDLLPIVERLPARRRVDILPTLRRELANLLHRVIMSIRAGEVTAGDQVASVLGDDWLRVTNFVEVSRLEIRSKSDFAGVLRVLDKFGVGEQWCAFDHRTQTNDPALLSLATMAPAEAKPAPGARGEDGLRR